MNINNIITLLRDWANTAGVPQSHLLNEAALRIETEARLADELAEALSVLSAAGEKLLAVTPSPMAGTEVDAAVDGWEDALLHTLILWKWRQSRTGDSLPRDNTFELSNVVDALLERPFRGSSDQRRDRLYGDEWAAVHDALDAFEAVRER